MEECWRWYGPDFDRLTLPEIAQTGATGIVHALHEIPYGEVWSREAIAARKGQIEAAGFRWSVVESLPIHERIKRDDGDLSALFANYRQSMANLAAEGIEVICYNFMPVLDWTRTDLQAPLARGGTCLRFEAYRMAAFEIHMLGRAGAENDYSPEVCARAKAWFEASTEADRNALLHAIMSGLPGAFDRYDIDGLRGQLALYDGIGREEIRRNYKRFLEEVIPTAEELGIRMCVHPDDPPRDILGLPRVVSNAEDIAWILQAVESVANGLTLCTGSLGANPANDPAAIAAQFAARIHFAHLRNVKKDPDGSFEEAAHLGGDTDMVAVVKALLAEETRRVAEGRSDAVIPMRPDHGQELLSDIGRGTFPGYPLIGRMRGLAELRGVMAALAHG
ncbi:D-mannonate dehydratase [Rhodobacter aestuarii]|uniref:Mannonate dehydratase n=1 Tax=Rhodobacter aestuarii TaxID=453582 RepID=A0A1N7PKN8_9RHOB|nr:mannonate dehydratase [Rhodobacter aestuarii]PTV94350.1 D-mannonate dehydratase [Rhodobacter aestuarii]SIT11050.1 D-mannonate dehydratase [Rhodobacter aestuarii]